MSRIGRSQAALKMSSSFFADQTVGLTASKHAHLPQRFVPCENVGLIQSKKHKPLLVFALLFHTINLLRTKKVSVSARKQSHQHL